MKAKDETGNRYGKLVALNRWGLLGNKIAWMFRCDCGNEKAIRIDAVRSGNTISCGCRKLEASRTQPTMEKSPNWKGGRRIDGGYVFVYHPDHPMAKKNGYVREHAYVMCEHLGRTLIKGENVHHINGNKEDNRIENLELWSTSQPCGQRVEDKLKWARDIINQYENGS